MEPVMNTTLTTLSAVTTFVTATALVLAGAVGLIEGFAKSLPYRFLLGLLPFLVDIYFYMAFYDASAAYFGHGHIQSWSGMLVYTMSPTVRFLVFAVMIAFQAWRLRRMRAISRKTISSFSVGEVLDYLPAGFAFVSLEGQIMQYNTVIDDLSYDITGETVMNAEVFWEALKDNVVLPGRRVIHGDRPLVEMPDGKVWLFQREELDTKLGKILQVTAVDATREQQLVNDLRNANAHIYNMNQRMRRYNQEMDDTIRKEELVEAKRRVHDRMGEALIAARMYLLNETSPVTPAHIFEQWERDLSVLIKEADKEETVTMISRFKEAGEKLGIKLLVLGEMPKDEEIAGLISTGIQECMTNAILHAEADKMYVTITRKDDSYRIHYSNNGLPMPGPVKEGGGLSMLRQACDKLGARMTYREGKHFILQVDVPMRKERDVHAGLNGDDEGGVYRVQSADS